MSQKNTIKGFLGQTWIYFRAQKQFSILNEIVSISYVLTINRFLNEKKGNDILGEIITFFIVRSYNFIVLSFQS